MIKVPSVVNNEPTFKFKMKLSVGRVVNLEGRTDPLDVGVETFVQWVNLGQVPKTVLTPSTLINWNLAQPKLEDQATLCDQWARAAGLPDQGYRLLIMALEYFDEVEADFQLHYRLNLENWLDGGISTRRVLNLLNQLSFMTDSLFWSQFRDIHPLSRTDILLAQIFQGLTGQSHQFLTSKTDERNRVEQEEKIKKIRERGTF